MKQNINDERNYLRDIACEDVGHELTHVIINSPALFDGRHNTGEVIVRKDHVGGFACDVGSGRAHCYTDISTLECGSVINTIAGNGYDLALSLQNIHQSEFVFR